MIAIHWATALLLVAIIAAGYTMTELASTDPLRRNLGRLHTIGGNLLGLMTLARLVVLRRSARPPALGTSRVHAKGIAAVHALLYVLTFAVIGTGLGTALPSTWHEYLKGDLPTPPSFEAVASRQVHETLAFVLAVLVTTHILGVIVQEVRGGGVLRRMLPFLR